MVKTMGMLIDGRNGQEGSSLHRHNWETLFSSFRKECHECFGKFMTETCQTLKKKKKRIKMIGFDFRLCNPKYRTA